MNKLETGVVVLAAVSVIWVWVGITKHALRSQVEDKVAAMLKSDPECPDNENIDGKQTPCAKEYERIVKEKIRKEIMKYEGMFSI